MLVRPTRAQVAAVFVASSGGAQVLAGVNGGISHWQLLWLLVTIAAAAAGVLFAADDKKNPANCGARH
ncbi:hypothetical protein [Amycolatopsis eburnea]|uniref:Uncharacterized protein n=1 Tax=Amycolatopsis eburnea TaxID=2267691 RepID=A0A3R9DBD2_9PSEU|nr:hypothetical protein [Amycolatopsis eburnea]RSD07979.1 hypothetical protein EIY87_45220 [Amycolatopsis eburnea]